MLLYLFRKMPEKEADHLTPATRLLEKKREMAEVEQALQATKDVCKNYILGCILYSTHFLLQMV